MPLTIRTNIAAINSIGSLNKSQMGLSSSLEKISSGFRINRAADDAAGMSIAMRMKSDIGSAKQAMRNTNDGISMVQTAEGGLSELHNILVRLRELSVQALNETYHSTDRQAISTEAVQLNNEFARIVTTANFNRKNLLNSSDTSFSIQVGIHNNADNRISINLSSLNATMGSLGMTGVVNRINSFGYMSTARGAVGRIDSALKGIATRRARLGAIQNRMENALSFASNQVLNMESAQSQIMDVDYASESANMTRYQIQQQASVAALAQAKSLPQSIISLLS